MKKKKKWSDGAFERAVAAALRAKRKPKPLPIPLPNESHLSLGFWRSMGVWITRIDHFPAVYMRAYTTPAYTFVVVPCLFGVEREGNTEGLEKYVADLKGLGFKVVGSQWGLAQGSVEAVTEAKAGAKAVRDFGFDGWVMNGEKLYEGGGKAGAYATEFRYHHPLLPFGWSPEPRLDLDHTLLQKLGVAYMPQAYPLENRYDVTGCVSVGVEILGYRRENIIPLIQAYVSPKGERYPAVWYREQARAAGIPGLILYAGNQVADDAQYWKDLVV